MPRRAASCSRSKACRPRPPTSARNAKARASTHPIRPLPGFLKSTGLRLEDLVIQDEKKGRFYIARFDKPGRLATDVIAEIIPEILRKFPWPKSMRWGSGALRWVRPLQSILATFDGEVVPFAIDGIASGDVTRGHRFMAPEAFTARRFADYAQKLHEAKVIVDSDARAETIRAEARNLAFAQGLELIEDEGLLKETAGLVEWPVVLMGTFDTKFLDLPPEVIATSIKNHQKCFAVKDGKIRQARQSLHSRLQYRRARRWCRDRARQ